MAATSPKKPTNLAELAEARRDVGVRIAEHHPPDAERIARERVRRMVFALRPAVRSRAAPPASAVWALAEPPCSRRSSSARPSSRDGERQVVEVGVDATERLEHPCLRQRLGAESLGPRNAAPQQVRGSQRIQAPLRRVARLEQADEEPGDRLRFAKRALRLPERRRGAVALARRHRGEAERHAGGDHQQQHARRGEGAAARWRCSSFSKRYQRLPRCASTGSPSR